MKTNEEFLKKLQNLSPKQKKILSSCSLVYYANEFLFLENGEKFSFKDHKYLFQIYSDTREHMIIQKAAQMGITTFAFIKAIWGCMFLFPLGVIYFFPTQSDVFDFSRARITPFLVYNQDLKMVDDEDVNNVGLKKIGKSYIYFRGMKTTIGMKSVPADMIIFDEIDEATPLAREMALKRIDHSEFKWVLELSNPTIENYGINKAFQESDCKYWFLKCEGCNEWISLDKTFPDCLIEKDGDVKRICVKCGKEININGQGEWVAEYPSRQKSGYLVSQLYSPYISPRVIYDEYQSKKGYELEVFYRMRLGRAYTIAENRITKQEILNLQQKIEIPSDSLNFLGVDQGKDLHIVLLSKVNEKFVLRKLFILTKFEDINKIIQEYDIKYCVIDALPETRKVKELIEKNKNIVFANYYASVKNTRWNHKDGIVETNRTMSLDYSQDIIKNNLIIKEGLNYIEDFALHCENIVRKIEENEDGSKEFVWVKTGPDHFRHAFNYATIAAEKYNTKKVSATLSL